MELDQLKVEKFKENNSPYNPKIVGGNCLKKAGLDNISCICFPKAIMDYCGKYRIIRIYYLFISMKVENYNA